MKPQTKLIIALILIIASNFVKIILQIMDFSLEFSIADIYAIQSITNLVGLILGLSYLLSNTDFRKTIYQKLFYVCYAIMLVGTLAKLQHWSWANTALTIGVASLIIVYGIRFIKKPIKQFPDYLKLFWFTAFFISRYLLVQHNPIGYYLLIISLLLFITLLFYFIHHERTMKLLENEIETLQS